MILPHVSPKFAGDDPRDMLLAETKLIGKLSLSFPLASQLSNLTDVALCDLRDCVRFSISSRSSDWATSLAPSLPEHDRRDCPGMKPKPASKVCLQRSVTVTLPNFDNLSSRQLDLRTPALVHGISHIGGVRAADKMSRRNVTARRVVTVMHDNRRLFAGDNEQGHAVRQIQPGVDIYPAIAIPISCRCRPRPTRIGAARLIHSSPKPGNLLFCQRGNDTRGSSHRALLLGCMVRVRAVLPAPCEPISLLPNIPEKHNWPMPITAFEEAA